MTVPYAEFGAEQEPPWSREAEQGLLGALLNDNGAIALVGDLVDAQSFFAQSHRLIFAAITALIAERHPADCVTVFERLQQTHEVEDFGGLKYINALFMSVPSARAARRYAEIVADRYAERLLIAGCDEARRISTEQGSSLGDRLERITSVLARVEQQRKGVGNRVPLLRLDALRKASQSIRWLVKHVVPAESIGMVFGGSGTFKSFIAIDMALHVAHGLPWMGRRTDKGAVLYIAAEGGAGLWNRIDAWHRARNLRWQDAELYVVPAAVDLTVDAWRVVDAAQAVGATPMLVVVDTLSQTYAGEENSANEMAAYLRELGVRFRQLWQCAVLLIHHSGHQATERPRGSSAIRGNLDFMFGVHRDEREMLATLSCAKQKDGELFDEATFALNVAKLGLDDEGDDVTSLVARHLSTQDEINRAAQAEAEAGRGGRDQKLLGLVSNGMTEKELRKAFMDTIPELDYDARKKAFYRARDRAIKAALIDVAEGFVIDLRKGR